MKKYKLVILHFAIILLILGLTVKFTEEIQTAKQAIYYALHMDANQTAPAAETEGSQLSLHTMVHSGDEWFLKYPLIFHAGGEINGSSYTNSVEAVEETLTENGGKCVVEMDLSYTSDGALVCVHNWSDAILNQQDPVTLAEFLSCRIQGKFTPLSVKQLLQLMREHPQMYLVTDVKTERDSLKAVITDLVRLCNRDESILSRFIIQVYTGGEKPDIQKIYPFADEQFILTAYQMGGWQPEIAQICNEEDISVVTVASGQMPDEDVALLRGKGFAVYEFTVNRADVARQALQRGISGFYTDNLALTDLEQQTIS